MGRKKVGQEQLCDYIAKNKSRAKKSAEKVEEKLKGKRMIPDPSRKGCYIYVDEVKPELVAASLNEGGGIGLEFRDKPTLLGVDMSAIARVPETSLIGILMDGMKENEKPQENEYHMVGGRYKLEEVEKLIGKKFPQENEVVDELDHVQKFGPSFGAYPVEDGESLFRFTGISPQDGKSMVAMERDLWDKGIRLGEEE